MTTAERRLVGRLVSIDGEALKLESVAAAGGQRVIAIPRASIMRLEVSERPSRKGEGTRIGLIAGLAAALVLGVTSNGGGGAASCVAPPPGVPPPPCNDTNVSDARNWLALLALPVGTALLGRAIAPGEKWRAVDAAELSIRLGPSPGGGAALSVVVGF